MLTDTKGGEGQCLAVGMLLRVLLLAVWRGEADQDVLLQQGGTQVSRIPQRMQSTCAASLTPMPCLSLRCH